MEDWNMCARGIVLAFLRLALLPWFAQALAASSSEYAKNQIVFPNEPFEYRHYGGTTNMGWIKFTIPKEAGALGPVTYQDSRVYSLHYDFVTRHLDPFVGISPEEFESISLYEQGQRLILGAVITPPKAYPSAKTVQEVGIQFVRSDPYAKEEIVQLFEIVKASVITDPNVTFYYFPTYEQSNVARDYETWFAEQGVVVSSPDRWLEGNVIYSRGWALGRLRRIPPDQIQTAYVKGDLLASDILLTDAVPAEIPVVAGIISLSSSTPNSHVAILATTYAIPFVYLADESTADRALALLDHEVVLRATPPSSWGNQVDLIVAEGVLSEQQRNELLALKRPPDLDIQSTAFLGSYSLSLEEATLDDMRHVGGKAAHYSLLRNAVPDNSVRAVAFTFDLWNEFLDQSLANGMSLREEIRDRLSAYAFPPADMAALEKELSVVRSLFTNDAVTDFSESLRDAVIGTLTDERYGFDPNSRIRFRSSTNVEDSEYFTGAGLYDSYSGCLADDLDGDDSGPCRCDAAENKERGVFRAIRKVFASFYNTNAFVERLRHQIDEDQVGMALLVHHSFPDEIELANGVATLSVSQSSRTNIQLVTQTQAISVSNPNPGVVPEQVTSVVSSTGEIYLRLNAYSNRVPLGQTVMTWEQDYRRLSQLLVMAAREYGRATGKTEYLLDLEYKKIAPNGDLIIKQIRPIPQSTSAPETPAFLISQPVELEVLQGKHSEVFANHRLKSVWLLNCESKWLTEENLYESFFTDINLDYVDAGQVHHLTGQLPSLPSFAHEPPVLDKSGRYQVHDSWLMPHLANQRSYTLQTTRIPSVVPSGQCPVIILGDLQFECDVLYNKPVPMTAYGDTLCATSQTTNDHVVLDLRHQAGEDDLLQTRTVVDGDVTVRTQFYWPPAPTGPTAGYTAPVVRWMETTLTGLTETPIVLQSTYAQTYVPGHHNFWETFLFEPRLDPNVPSEVLAELEDNGIEQIMVFTPQPSSICTHDSYEQD
jgi:hypothetical protein